MSSQMLQTLGWIIAGAGVAWILFQDKLFSVFRSSEKVEPNSASVISGGTDWAIKSRFDAIRHADSLLDWFEKNNNTSGAESIRSAISSIYAPKG